MLTSPLGGRYIPSRAERGAGALGLTVSVLNNAIQHEK